MPFFRVLNRAFVLPITGLTLGMASNIRTWPDATRNIPPHKTAHLLKEHPEYQKLESQPTFKTFRYADIMIPHFRATHIGFTVFDMDPIIFNTRDEAAKNQELVAICPVNRNKLSREMEAILLDELLCVCGFPLLPHGKGVTARLSIKWESELPEKMDHIVLRAKVLEHKGRRCVIEGSLGSIDSPDTIYSRATCVLVEPRWFRWAEKLGFLSFQSDE